MKKRAFPEFSFMSRTQRGVPFFLIGIVIMFLPGCGNNLDAGQKGEVSQAADSTEVRKAEVETVAVQAVTKQVDETSAAQSEFAPTVTVERRGLWKGGAAPHNKSQSGVYTYYRLKQSDKAANRLTMTLRFEGIVADDAAVEFRPIDGAIFASALQRSEWRLRPNEVSQVSFDVVVPTDKPSYLTLTTLQHQMGSARAFLLEAP